MMQSALSFSTALLLTCGSLHAFVQVPVAPRFQPNNIQSTLQSSLIDETQTKSDTIDRLSELPPVLQDIVDERNEFRLNLGHAMDVLRQDYPEILRSAPDFSIYHDQISLVDPSGTQLTGLKNYKTAFSILQTMISFLYSRSKSGIQIRMVYDFCRSSIRISWNVMLYPKGPFGKPLYIDGVSIYTLDAPSGKISEHKIENLIINQTPVAPPYGIFSTLLHEQYALAPQGCPAGVWGIQRDDSAFA